MGGVGGVGMQCEPRRAEAAKGVEVESLIQVCGIP